MRGRIAIALVVAGLVCSVGVNNILERADSDRPDARTVPDIGPVPDVSEDAADVGEDRSLVARILVLQEDEVPLPGATVEVFLAEESTPLAVLTTDDAGRCQMTVPKPAQYTFKGRKSGFIEQVAFATAPAEVKLVLARGARLTVLLEGFPSPAWSSVTVQVRGERPRTFAANAAEIDTGFWRADGVDLSLAAGKDVWRVGSVALHASRETRFRIKSPQTVVFPVVVRAESRRGQILHAWSAQLFDADELQRPETWKVARRTRGDGHSYRVEVSRSTPCVRVTHEGYAPAPLCAPGGGVSRTDETPQLVILKKTAGLHVLFETGVDIRSVVAYHLDSAGGVRLSGTSTRISAPTPHGALSAAARSSAWTGAFPEALAIASVRTPGVSAVFRDLPADTMLAVQAERADGTRVFQYVRTGPPGSMTQVRLGWSGFSSLVCQIVSANGTAAQSVVVDLIRGKNLLATVRTDERGRATFHGLIKSRAYQVRTWSAWTGTEEAVPEKALHSGEWTLTLRDPPVRAVSVTVRDHNGAGLSSVPVALCVANGGSKTFFTGNDGILLADVPKGVIMTAVIFPPGQRASIVRPIPAANQVEVTLADPPEAIAVDVTLHGDPRAVTLIVEAAGQQVFRRRVHIDGLGRVLLGELKAGEYQLTVESAGDARTLPFAVGRGGKTRVLHVRF